MNKKVIFSIFLLLFSFNFFGYSKNYLKKECPYSIYGEPFFYKNGINTGFEFFIENNGENPIEKFSIVFSMFDEDGEPVFDSGWISIDVEKTILQGETYSYMIDIEDFINADDVQTLITDYLYLSKIVFANGEVWEDPFGLYAIE